MGCRAQYVLKDGAAWTRYYSQWGAYSMELDLLAGPVPATRFVAAQRADDFWMHDCECEGAALIDHGEQRLLWWSDCLGDVAYRAAAVEVMARTWQGWRIDWAYGGLEDIKKAVGQGRPREFEAVPQSAADSGDAPSTWLHPRSGYALEPADPIEDGEVCLVTIESGDDTEAYTVRNAANWVLRSGAGSLVHCLRRSSPVTSWPRFPSHGVHLEVETRTAGVWTTGELGGELLDGRHPWWPGLRWEVWEDRYDEQLRRAAGAITVPPPDREEGLRKLAEEFRSHQKLDSATRSVSLLLQATNALKATAEQSGMEAHVVVDNAFAHRPIDLTDQDRAAVFQAIEAAESGTGGGQAG